ncbi:MAG TPA: alpha-ketoglutarate-dependent dioxygenase AlkB [Streptosporangiaceae bacterium]|nr:alpha-ketoglutarate-dependent dioxygenase AlkB [Streptosporangiaceae bacterium]
MSAAFQASLLDAGQEFGLGDLGTLSHRVLADGAWVDVLPGWMSGADELFGRLLRTVPWRAERRPMYDQVVDVPRLLSWYGKGERLPDQALEQAMAALDSHYRPRFSDSRFSGSLCTAGLCLYRDGRDSVAWHGDTSGRRVRETIVAILSLGNPRALLLRPRGGGRALRFLVGHGDLLVMGGTCQRTWEHSVPKTARATGPRISVQFRPEGIH